MYVHVHMLTPVLLRVLLSALWHPASRSSTSKSTLLPMLPLGMLVHNLELLPRMPLWSLPPTTMCLRMVVALLPEVPNLGYMLPLITICFLPLPLMVNLMMIWSHGYMLGKGVQTTGQTLFLKTRSLDHGFWQLSAMQLIMLMNLHLMLLMLRPFLGCLP